MALGENALAKLEKLLGLEITGVLNRQQKQKLGNLKRQSINDAYISAPNPTVVVDTIFKSLSDIPIVEKTASSPSTNKTTSDIFSVAADYNKYILYGIIGLVG